MRETCDLLVIGGGINGAGIARDAAGRGLSVVLVERGDLGGATSSASSKLIHGGLRYLEQYEFSLVREALAEREVLLRLAPHIAWPLRFVLPHRPAMRPAWLIRAGLFLYDHLARRVTLPGSETLAPGHRLLAPLTAGARGFAYSDAWVEDSRLTLLNARDAARKGAEILVRTGFEGADRVPDGWIARLAGGRVLHARALVNAAGPWVMQAQAATGAVATGRVRLIRGSHIVVPRLYGGDQAFILQNDDGRVVFVIPYETDFSLIGTTDEAQGEEAPVCTPAEEAYLCAAVSTQFARPVTPADIVWRYAGVRPLFDDGAAAASEVTRDYVLRMDTAGAPLLTVYGGKITTFRHLAEEAVDQLCRALGTAGRPWTAGSVLPGGDLGGQSLPAFEDAAAARFPWLPRPVLARMLRCYGAEIDLVLAGAEGLNDLGPDLGAGLFAQEIAWMKDHEFARTAEDVLWRRTKRGLHLDPAGQARAARAIEALLA